MKHLKLKAALVTAALTMGLSAAHGAPGDATITVNAAVSGNCKFQSTTATIGLAVDPTATGLVSAPGTVTYRCTKGTTPNFGFSSLNSGALVNGLESFAYTYITANDGAGSGMGGGQDKNLTVTVSVDQANAANVTPGTYTDTMTITIAP